MSANGGPIARWTGGQDQQEAVLGHWARYQERGRAYEENPILPREPCGSIGHKDPSYTYTLPGPVREGEETAPEDVAANIWQYMVSGDGPRPVVDCGVCYGRLMVPWLQERENTDAGIELLALHQLRCGHVLCRDCLAEYLRSQLRSSAEAINPACPSRCGPVYDEATTEAERAWEMVQAEERWEEEAERRREEGVSEEAGLPAGDPQQG